MTGENKKNHDAKRIQDLKMMINTLMDEIPDKEVLNLIFVFTRALVEK